LEADTIHLLGTDAGTSTQVITGIASNRVLVGDTNQKDPNPDQLDVIQGPLSVIGQGSTQLEFDDKQGPAARTYTVGSGSLTFNANLPAIQFSNITTAILDAAAAATVNVIDEAASTTDKLERIQRCQEPNP